MLRRNVPYTSINWCLKRWAQTTKDGSAMSITLLVISRLCVVWIVIYVLFSLRSALWAGARHSGGILLLEFQPHRARGPKELARARLLRRLAWSAALALPLGIATFVAGVAMA
jgi:hypothetical protein